jgi:hypothetical protein
LTTPLVAATTCDNCHEFDNAPEHAGDPPYAPFNTWRTNLMAQASRDPVFWAGVAIASQDHPAETQVCIQCHAPRAFLEGRGDAISQAGLLSDDLDGAECEFCHRMVDDGIIGNAQYTIDDVVVQGGKVARRGPWTYVGQDPPHPWLEDPFTGSSEACGVCHDVTTPRERVDDSGVGMGVPFNEQRTYSEWNNSDLSMAGPGFRSCQDCHMPEVLDMPGCASWVGGGGHPTGGRRHDLVGANRFMIELLRDLYGSAGTGEFPDAYYDETLARTDELIATAATLDVATPGSVDLGVGLGLQVTVTNDTGHKLPSGYSEGRIMWIEIVADYQSTTVYKSGLYQPGIGPEMDAQLRTYRGVAEEYATGTTNHLLLNDHWVEDTRIPPLGLIQDPETDPVGDRYSPLVNGRWPNYDIVDYTFGPEPAVQDVTPAVTDDDDLAVRVRVLLLVNTPEYIDFLADENVTNSAGMAVAGMFDNKGGATPVVVSETTVVIPIDGFWTGGTTGTTGTTSDGTTTGTTGATSGGPTSTASTDTASGSAGSGTTDDTTTTATTTTGATTTTATTTTGATTTTATTTTGATTTGDTTSGTGTTGSTTTSGLATDATSTESTTSTASVTTTGTDGDTGTDEGGASTDDTSCSCRTEPTGLPASWLLLLLGVRRRSRTRECGKVP